MTSKKVSTCPSERNDPEGIHPLFNHSTGEVIGEQRHGKLIYFTERNQNSSTPLTDSYMNGTDFPSPQTTIRPSVNRLTKPKSLTELLGGP